jgi:hypothetical protein
LDPYRKVRRDVLSVVNKIRNEENLESLKLDKFINEAATEYAEYCATKERDGNPEVLQEILKKTGVPGTFKAAVGYRYLEDEEQSTAKANLAKLFVDAHGLTFELNETREEILKADNTHAGLGLAIKDNLYMITELYSSKPLKIEGIRPTEDEKAVEMMGKMITEGLGPYALRVYSPAEPTKNIALIGPESMKFNIETKEFLMYVDKPELLYVNPPLAMEVYLRNNPQKIPYQQPQAEDMAKQLTFLILGYKGYLELFPDPRIQAEEVQDRAREEQEEHEKKRVNLKN